MEPKFCGPNPDFLGTTVNFDVLLPEKWVLRPHQTHCVLHLGLWVHKRFLCITYRRCMTASATPYAKDFLSPIFGYEDRCFVIVIPFMMIFLMECSTTPILVNGLVGFMQKISIVGFPRIILFGVKWLVENGVLVRQLCRVDQKLRPFLYHPS